MTVSTPPSTVCFTVDVEDWYDGMEVLGTSVCRRPCPPSNRGLATLVDLVELSEPAPARLTFFVVGRYAAEASPLLTRLVAAGHEIGSHGPDHGRLPADVASLGRWLRSGREMIEDAVQAPVTGFRPPRFDLPPNMDLDDFRALVADAGFTYVSDTSLCGSSALGELPVLSFRGFPIGGGSYQRLVPLAVTAAAVRRHAGVAVLYYHSYDFGRELPSTAAIRSTAVAAQVLGRHRIANIFSGLLARFGSTTCATAVNGGDLRGV